MDGEYQSGICKTRITIPKDEFTKRINKIQIAMDLEGIDVLVTHACECESANVRYLSNFWAVFDFAGVIIPRKGNAVLLTGGPESFEFAKQFSQIDDVRVHPLYVETSAPVWDKPVNVLDFTKLLDEFRSRISIKKIGLANSNIIPAIIMKDLIKGAKGAEFVLADELLMKVRWFKSINEVAVLKEAYRITEKGMKEALNIVKPGVSEWEIEARWRSVVYGLGAEGTSYPIWVTSGPRTYQSLCRSTDRIIGENDIIQLTFGAKYNGYCGNLCRPVVLGNGPARHMKMQEIALEALNEALSDMGPGIPFSVVYDHFHERLSRNGFSGLALYGPAHGTGMQECEGPWVDNRSSFVMQASMVFNVDIWIADEKYGVRFEDGVLITENGLEMLTGFCREIIRM
jgi:Xaa-Pro aminopeptidase